MQAELRDIHLPDPVSWWPLAPGWYGILLLLLLISVISWWLVHKRRHPSLKKLAALELQHIEQAFNQHQNSQQLCSEISILLRRVAISYDSRNNQAGVTGKQWLNHLNNLVDQPLFDAHLSGYLLFAPYQKHSTEPAEKLIVVTRQWISLLPGRSVFSQLRSRHITKAKAQSPNTETNKSETSPATPTDAVNKS